MSGSHGELWGGLYRVGRVEVAVTGQRAGWGYGFPFPPSQGGKANTPFVPQCAFARNCVQWIYNLQMPAVKSDAAASHIRPHQPDRGVFANLRLSVANAMPSMWGKRARQSANAEVRL